jgi:hypothetical protein
MNTKIGRNDPCPCGSGRKYKQCHGREAVNDAPTPDDGERAVERALGWLHEFRRKAFGQRLQELIDDLVFDPARQPARLPDDFLQQVQINFTEWVLADGSIPVRGTDVRTIDLVLGTDGPAFSPAQRQRLEQLREQPLRLYTVTDVQSGRSLTLCDALDTAAAPVVVDEDLGSRALEPGMLIGARILHLDNRRELSGAIYGYTPLGSAVVTEAVRAAAEAGAGPYSQRAAAGYEIMREWARQFTEPRRVPKMMDAASGEPLLLITDHYRVRDDAALARALAGCADVSGDARQGWRREFTGSDGLVRSSVVVNPGKQPDRIEVFYRTQRQADEGRPWFEGVAGAAVAHLTREITDPQGALAHPSPGSAPAATGAPDAALPPEVLAQAVEQIMRKHYANWCDEPIPALGGQTPRQAIATAAGLERVKGLLRSYEEGEDRQSTAQGRPAFSYQFLWDALGLQR